MFMRSVIQMVAAGWAHLLAGDRATARQRFEFALSLDGTFAEIHGSLAALDALEGASLEAERRMIKARRLDPECYSAALTGIILAGARGDETKAQRIFEMTLQQRVSSDGRTLAQILAKHALQ